MSKENFTAGIRLKPIVFDITSRRESRLFPALVQKFLRLSEVMAEMLLCDIQLNFLFLTVISSCAYDINIVNGYLLYRSFEFLRTL